MDDIEQKREAVYSELLQWQNKANEELSALRRASDDARAAVQEATAMLVQAKQDLLMAELAELNAFNCFESKLAPRRAYLEQTAPTMIKAFLAELIGHQARLRNRNIQTPDVPDLHGELRKQTPILNERWKQTEILREWQTLLRDTTEHMRALLREAVDVKEAAAIVVEKRGIISRAYVAASQAGVALN